MCVRIGHVVMQRPIVTGGGTRGLTIRPDTHPSTRIAPTRYAKRPDVGTIGRRISTLDIHEVETAVNVLLESRVRGMPQCSTTISVLLEVDSYVGGWVWGGGRGGRERDRMRNNHQRGLERSVAARQVQQAWCG
jgi:hypothetical protein